MSFTINIAKEFTRNPGPRYRVQGKHSGEEFKEALLRPKFDAALAAGEALTIELDGVEFGYPTSFLEEAFGGLARDVGIEPVRQVLRYEATIEPQLVEEIDGYVRDCHLKNRVRNR